MEVFNISRNNNQTQDMVNENIRFKEVLVIAPDGSQLGVMSRNDAINAAYDAELDLVCVAPKAKVPVCRIMDYGKYRFEQQKKAKEMKKKSKAITIKETQLSPTIDVHDKDVKLKRTIKWLQAGDKVKITVRFKGRQLAHVEIGQKTIDDFIDECKEYCVIERAPKLEGRTMIAILAPKKK